MRDLLKKLNTNWFKITKNFKSRSVVNQRANNQLKRNKFCGV